MLFKKCEGSSNSKHDNFARLWSHLNGIRLHRSRRAYQTPKHHHMHRDKTIDKTWFFSVNPLALTHVESKFCMDRLWNKVHGISTCV